MSARLLSRRDCIAAMTASVTMPSLVAQGLGGRYLWMYVGTYTGPKSLGIHLFRFDTTNGVTEPRGVVAQASNPTFLAIHPNGRFLYCANETSKWGEKPGGYVSAYAINPSTGGLSGLNQQSVVGAGPCHLNVDSTGKALLVANYGGGSVAVCPIRRDGSLQPHSAFVQHTGSSTNPARQKEPHAHSVNLSRDNRFAFVADLGLDQILVYRFNAAKGTLAPHDPPFARVAPGSGPRHLAFSPDGQFAYVINELTCTMTVFSYDEQQGQLKEIQTVSTLPAGEAMSPSYSTAEVRVHPTGKVVYGSNRGHHSIAVFAAGIDGRLTPIQHVSTQGRTPRNFNLDPAGRFLFAENQDTHDIFQFRIDTSNGKLIATKLKLEVGSPVCIRFAPSV